MPRGFPAPSLLAYRTVSNLSRRKLAFKAGVSDRTILRIESGAAADVETLERLANALGITAVRLMQAPPAEISELPPIPRPVPQYAVVFWHRRRGGDDKDGATVYPIRSPWPTVSLSTAVATDCDTADIMHAGSDQVMSRYRLVRNEWVKASLWSD